jgi:lipopolysaccharide transport system ATP-binding protein
VANPAITVEGLGKRYRLGVTGSGDRLTERLAATFTAPARLLSRHRRPAADAPATDEDDQILWALRDVSFEVAKGEVIGLVGTNGAGKSTLLKVLSRITPPTVGRALVDGRLGSLLEVGTGFHPELTGRENIFLNGAILGMRRSEIRAQFDEIVEFSGVQRFLDTPVKRYSSGMYVRLAFAVAAHLRPEILLVDEVLAVGDAEFQRKCLGKMQEVSDEGRTVVFVSHNLGAVRRLCPRSLLIEGGRLVEDDTSDRIIASYLRRVGRAQQGGVAVIPPRTPRYGIGGAKLTRVELRGGDGQHTSQLHFREPFSVDLIFEVEREIPDACVQVGIAAAEGTRVLTAHNIDGDRPPMRLEPGERCVRANLDVTLLPGDFVLDVALLDSGGGQIEYLERVLSFNTVNAALDEGDVYPWGTVRGAIRPASRWSLLSQAQRLPV